MGVEWTISKMVVMNQLASLGCRDGNERPDWSGIVGISERSSSSKRTISKENA